MTEYTVALKNLVSGPAAEALRDARKLREELGGLEGQRAARAGRGAGDALRAQRQLDREAQRAVIAQQRLEAEALRSAKAMEDAKRNAAFKRLREQQREEERFTQYRIRLMRREVAEAQRAAAQERKGRLAYIQGGPGGAGGGLGSVLGAVGIAGGYGAAIAAAGYVGKTGLDTANKIEQAKLRLAALLGSQETAANEIKDLVRAASRTKFDWEDLVDASSALSASFGDTQERRYVLASISDLVTVAGEGKDTLQQVILAVNQTVGKGKLESEELNQIIEPLKGVVTRRDFYKEVARLMDVKGKDDDDLVKKIQQRQKAGEISARTAVQALTNVGRARVGGGAAGAFAVKAGDTIEGQISNIRTGLATLFAAADLEKWPAMMRLRELLGDIASLFTVDSKEGQDFMAFLKFYSDVVITSFITLGRVLIYPLRGIIAITNAIREMVDAARFTSITDLEAWGDIGRNIVLGIANGIKSGAVWVYDALRDLGTGAVDTLKQKLHIQSPSKVMYQLGAYTTEGYARGISSGADRVAAASAELGQAAVVVGAGAAASAGGRGGSPAKVEINIRIDGAREPVETAQHTVQLIEATMDRYFGRFAAQGA